MEKLLKTYWEGNIPLVKSYWIGCVLVPLGLVIPFILIAPGYGETVSDAQANAIIVWFFVMLAANVFLIIGCFRSASKYIVMKRKKKKSVGWGRAAQVFLVLGALNTVKEVLTLFT